MQLSSWLERSFFATLPLAAVVACSASPSGGESVAQQDDQLHLCPEFIRFCAPPSKPVCTEDKGCQYCTCETPTPTPQPFAAGGYGSNIATDGTSVFWIDSADFGNSTAPGAFNVLTCPASGCAGSPTVLASGTAEERLFDNELSIVTDATNVYWTDIEGIYSCAKTGCGGTPNVVKPPSAFSVENDIATDGSNVYWVSGNGVLYCPTSGCSGAPAQLASAAGTFDLIADSSGIYWISVNHTTDQYSILHCAVGGCSAPSVVYEGATGKVASLGSVTPGYVISLTSDATNLYWVANLPSASAASYAPGLLSIPKAGGASQPTTIMPVFDFGSVQRTVADTTNVYWTTLTGSQSTTVIGSVVYCPVSGCPSTGPVTLWSESIGTTCAIGVGPYGIAATSSMLFWANTQGSGGPSGGCTVSETFPAGGVMWVSTSGL